jgi:hypothetical protein
MNTLTPVPLTQDQAPWDPAGFYDDPSPHFITNQSFCMQEDSDNKLFPVERLSSYEEDLDTDNFNTKTDDESDDIFHTDTHHTSDGTLLEEVICLNIAANIVLEMDNSQVPNNLKL